MKQITNGIASPYGTRGCKLIPFRWRYLVVMNIEGKGRGVFARREIPKGGLIERAPVLIIPDHHRAFADKTIIFQYVFMWEHHRRDAELCTGGSGRTAIALGITSLVNHSDRPNAACHRRIEAQEIELRAIRAIEAGDEIVISYDA
jgi:SET domain-containing protein